MSVSARPDATATGTRHFICGSSVRTRAAPSQHRRAWPIGRPCFAANSVTYGFCPADSEDLARVERHLHDFLAGIGRVGDLIGQPESVRLDQRLGEIDGVFDDVDVRQQIAVSDEPLGHAGTIAQQHAVAADPPGLQMIGFDDEDRPFPAAERESLPRVRRKSGGRGRPSMKISRFCSIHWMWV